MSLEVAQNKSNELDIDDGTMPIEDAAQTEDTEETAQIDDDGDVDGSQVSEVETADDAETDDAEESNDKAEGATEETPKAEKPEEPAAEAKPSEWQQYAEQFREEFGETAAKPFEALISQLERQKQAIDTLLAERQQAATRSDQQVAAQHMTAAGIDAKKHADPVDSTPRCTRTPWITSSFARSRAAPSAAWTRSSGRSVPPAGTRTSLSLRRPPPRARKPRSCRGFAASRPSLASLPPTLTSTTPR